MKEIMTNTPFKLKSGNSPLFKNIGSSPVRHVDKPVSKEHPHGAEAQHPGSDGHMPEDHEIREKLTEYKKKKKRSKNKLTKEEKEYLLGTMELKEDK